MGIFAETANVDYRLSLANQGNKHLLAVSIVTNKRMFSVLFSDKPLF
jgi:hypothetical protein